MEIRVYSPTLSFIGSIEDHTSLIWLRRYYAPGEFEIHVPITKKNLEYLQPGNIITKRGSAEAGVIESARNTETSKQNDAIRSGRFLSSYFSRRLIKQTTNFRGTPEKVMHDMINNATTIPLVECGHLKGIGGNVAFQATMKNLQTYLTKVARGAELGYRLRPDFRGKKLIFEVYQGVDRTLSGGVNGRVVFSEKYENANNAEYRYDDQLQKTMVYVGGEGEGANRIYETVGSGVGLGLREAFVDAKDIASEGLTGAEYRAALRQRGIMYMQENGIIESFEPNIDANRSFVYKEHYDLGDVVVTHKESWGFFSQKRITQIEEVYESGAYFVIPTFGDALPETIDWEDK